MTESIDQLLSFVDIGESWVPLRPTSTPVSIAPQFDPLLERQLPHEMHTYFPPGGYGHVPPSPGHPPPDSGHPPPDPGHPPPDPGHPPPNAGRPPPNLGYPPRDPGYLPQSMTSIYKVLSTSVESLTRLSLLRQDNIRVQ